MLLTSDIVGLVNVLVQRVCFGTAQEEILLKREQVQDLLFLLPFPVVQLLTSIRL